MLGVTSADEVGLRRRQHDRPDITRPGPARKPRPPRGPPAHAGALSPKGFSWRCFPAPACRSASRSASTTQGACSSRRRRPWCGWGHPRWLPPAHQCHLAYPHVALVFPQLRVAPFHQEPAAPAGRLCSCIAAGLKNRSALRSFIDGAHCLY